MQAFLTRGDGIEALRRRELPRPTPGPGQVLVRMSAVALNFRDLLVVTGVDGWRPERARVPVSDGVGTVVATGAGVSRFREGARVIPIFLPHWHDGELTEATYADALGGASADGVMAQLRVFDEQALVAAPAHLSDAEAATLPVAALTAWHALRYRSQVRAGDSVLIQGTGGVSLFALQFAHALGARALVLSSSEDKLARVRALGAADTLDYVRTPAWDEEVLARTDGRGVDHVIEVIGGENLNRSLRAVRIGGSISFIGLLAGLSAPIETYRFVTRNVRLHGIETGSRSMLEDLIAFLGQQPIRPVIDAQYPFPAFPEALRHLESGRHFGKVVVAMPA